MSRAIFPIGISLAALLALLLLAPFTALGTHFIVDAVGRLVPIEVKYNAGTLTGELQVSELRIVQDSSSIELDTVTASFAFSCLWQSEICIEKLQVQKVSIVVHDVNSEPDVDEHSQPLMKFPLSVSAPHVVIDAVAVNWPGGSWHNNAVTGAFTLRGSDIRISEARIGDAALNVAAEGAENPAPFMPPDIHLPFRLLIDGLVLTRPSWQMGDTEFSHDELQVQGSWAGTNITLKRLRLATPEWGVLAIKGNLAFADDWPMQLAVTANVARPPVWSRLHERSVSLSITGDLNELTIQGDSVGKQTLQLGATLDALSPGMPFTTEAQLTWDGELALRSLLDVPTAVSQLSIASPLQLQVSGTLERQSLEVAGAFSSTADSKVDIVLRGEHRAGLLAIEHLALSEETTDSALTGSGVLNYGDVLAGSIQLNSQGFDLLALDPRLQGRIQGELQVEGKHAPDEWQLHINQLMLNGEVNQLPATIAGSLVVESAEDLPVVKADLVGALNTAEFDLKTRPADSRFSRLNITVNDLSRWSAEGHGKLEVIANLDLRQQQLTLSGSGTNLGWRGMNIPQATLQGSAALQGEQVFSIALDATGFSFEELALEQLSLHVTGDSEQQQAVLVSTGDVKTELRLDGIRQNERWSGHLNPTEIHTVFGDWQLAEVLPLDWHFGNRALTLGPHCWRAGDASLCAPDPLRVGPTGDVVLELVGSMHMFQRLLPPQTNIEGNMVGSISTSWREAMETKLRLDWELSDLRFTRHYSAHESLTMSWDEGLVSVVNDGDGFHLQSNLSNSGGERLTADVNLAGTRDESITGQLDIQEMQLSTFEPLLPALSRFEGLVNGHFALSGSLNEPSAKGSIQLTGGHLAMSDNPTELSDLGLNIQFRGSSADIVGTALVGGGRLSLLGEVLLEPELQVRLDLNGDRHKIILPPYSKAEISHKLHLTATTQQQKLAGEVIVHSGLIQAEDLAEGSVDVSPDSVVVDRSGNVIKETSPFDANIDVHLILKEQLYLRTREIHANARGDLHLVRENREPMQLFGNLTVLGGNIEAYGQRLEIKTGTLGFVGEPENPELNLRAERKVSGQQVHVGIAARGTVAEPRLELYSEPAMSQAESLSYLTRGKGLDAGDTSDGSSMALALSTGVINRSGLLSGVNKLKGFNNVEFGSEGSAEETAATIGGYIGESIYLSYGVGLYEPITVLTARFYLLSNLWLEVVSRLENSVDIYYNFTLD